MPSSVTEADAWKVLHDVASGANASLGGRLVSVTAFGSLVNGDFVPRFSDIDQVIVVRSDSDWKTSVKTAQQVVRRMNRRQANPRLRLHEG